MTTVCRFSRSPSDPSPDRRSLTARCAACRSWQAAFAKFRCSTARNARTAAADERLIPVLDQMRSEDAKPAVQNPPDRGDLKRVVQCPQCNRRNGYPFLRWPGNVIVDTCDDCSLLWLDRGELTRIAHARTKPQSAILTGRNRNKPAVRRRIS